MPVSTEAVEGVVGEPLLDDLLDAVAVEFPDVDDRPAPGRLEELLLLRLANENPAARPLRALVDDAALPSQPRSETLSALETYQAGLTPIGPNGETLIEMLRAPARAFPTSLAGQLRYVREHWRGLLGTELDALLDRLLVTLDVIAEEERGLHLRFGGGGDGGGGGAGRGEAPDLTGLDVEPERFSSDSAWMPRLVLIAKSTYVWLDQLSRRYGRAIRHARRRSPTRSSTGSPRWGFTGLWLIGLWERSRASQRIKRLRGNPDAVASAYSLDDYRIADDLGGEAACEDLRERAWARGIRLAIDMVPNHMGIDSRWVVEHPDWFLSLPEPPVSGYTFNGPRPVAEDERVGICLEDHYWDNSDAAVVFKRVDRWTGDRALHLPRQRRHEHPVERHRAARLPPGRRPRGGHPDDPRRRAPVPDHPLRRRDDAGEAATSSGSGSRSPARGGAIPSRAEYADDAGGVRRRDAGRVLARGRRPRRRRGARHAAAGRGVLDDGGLLRPHARHAPRLQQRVHEHAARRGERELPQGHARTRSSSIPRSSSASSTS